MWEHRAKNPWLGISLLSLYDAFETKLRKVGRPFRRKSLRGRGQLLPNLSITLPQKFIRLTNYNTQLSCTYDVRYW